MFTKGDCSFWQLAELLNRCEICPLLTQSRQFSQAIGLSAPMKI